MRSLLKLTATLVAGGLLVGAAQAIPITGDITIVGAAVVPPTDDASTASKIVGFVGTVAVVADGDYAPMLGSSVAMHGFTFKPSFIAPVPDLWDATVGGIAYSFDLNSISSVLQGTVPLPNLHLTGLGVAHITGKDATPGVWRFDANGAGKMIFGFTSTNTGVPDGGMTIMLLGAALSGLGLVRRKLAN